MSSARAQTLAAEGASRREIADRLGVSERTVIAWLRHRPTFPERTCRLCGQRFVPTNGRQRYCTPEHWQQHRHGGPKLRECRLCGQPFRPTTGTHAFCTPQHRAEYQRQHGPPQTTEGWRQRVHQLEAELTRLRAQLERQEAA
jgi:transposase